MGSLFYTKERGWDQNFLWGDHISGGSIETPGLLFGKRNFPWGKIFFPRKTFPHPGGDTTRGIKGIKFTGGQIPSDCFFQGQGKKGWAPFLKPGRLHGNRGPPREGDCWRPGELGDILRAGENLKKRSLLSPRDYSRGLFPKGVLGALPVNILKGGRDIIRGGTTTFGFKRESSGARTFAGQREPF